MSIPSRQSGPFQNVTQSHQVTALDSEPLLPQNSAPQISQQEAVHIWSHSVLLAVHDDVAESLLEHRRLLSVCGNTIPRSLLLFNIGSLRSIVDSNDSAAEAFELSCREDPTLAIAWFRLGMIHFDTKNYATALSAFEHCMSCYSEMEKCKNYKPYGLDFKLEKTKVTWNIHLTRHHLAQQQGDPTPPTLDNPLNKIRKDLYFDAPEIVTARPEKPKRSSLGKLKGQILKFRDSLRVPEDGKVKRDSGLGDDTSSQPPGSQRSSRGS